MFDAERYYQDNKEKISTQKRKWYQDNKEKLRSQYAKYRQENREKINNWHKDYYQRIRKTMKKAITIKNIDSETFRKFKVACAENSIDMRQALIDFMAEYSSHVKLTPHKD